MLYFTMKLRMAPFVLAVALMANAMASVAHANDCGLDAWLVTASISGSDIVALNPSDLSTLVESSEASYSLGTISETMTTSVDPINVPSLSIQPVPEPSSSFLGGFALALIAGWRTVFRRRQ